jgi:ATP-binding cassette subfamily B multidrug efflux pump
MDRLVVLDRGRIVEEGDHRSLLEQGGLYARLWAHQSGGFLGDEPEEGEADHLLPGAEPLDSETAGLPRLEQARGGHDRLTGSEPIAS